MSTKGVNWTSKENEAVCIAYIQVTENSNKGTSQKEIDIWKQVAERFKDRFDGIPPHVRNFESCKNRWQKHLFPQMNKWHQCVTRVDRRIHSGANLADQQHLAEDFFKEDNGGKVFRFQNCYNLCSGTWVTFEDPPHENFGPSSVQRNNTFLLDDDEIQIDTPTPNYIPDPLSPPITTPTTNSTPNPLTRPIGRNTAKRNQLKAKEKDAKVFQEKLLANIDRLREENIKTEEARALREKMKEDRRVRERDEAILMMQINDFSPLSKSYFGGKKRETFDKLNRQNNARELFPNSATTSDEYHPRMSSQDED